MKKCEVCEKCGMSDSDVKDMEELKQFGKACGHMHKHGRGHGAAGAGGGVYFMGMIGAAVYFISTAPDFWMGVLGFLKAIVWPALLVFEAFRTLIG
ncbi:MAG: hypothetical protein WCI79_00775 [Candidatus Saccharibacteria bacterium]